MRLFNKIDVFLVNSLGAAVRECGNSNEEEGGIILVKQNPSNGGRSFKFVKVLNKMVGTPAARGLYVADPGEFGEKAFPLLTQGWRQYASFHTHPTFSPTPSSLDEDKLFRGFKYNFIFSNTEKTLSCSEWSPQNDLHTVYINIVTLIYLSNAQN